jgi:anti-sigma regulatory factor (Ser/Thr protein kinase)
MESGPSGKASDMPQHWDERLTGRTDRLELQLPAVLESVRVLRQALERMGLPGGVLQDAKLLSSELLTNSIEHAGLGADDRVQVTVARYGAVLSVVVRDGALKPDATELAGSFRPEPGRQSGWGLFLIDRIASRWGITLRGRSGYWFELRVDDPERDSR